MSYERNQPTAGGIGKAIGCWNPPKDDAPARSDVSQAAIEAATKAIEHIECMPDSKCNGGDLFCAGGGDWEPEARAALEAALPHLSLAHPVLDRSAAIERVFQVLIERFYTSNDYRADAVAVVDAILGGTQQENERDRVS